MRNRWSAPLGPEQRWKTWLLAFAVALLLQIPLIVGLWYIINRSVSEFEFRSAARETVALLDPESLLAPDEQGEPDPILDHDPEENPPPREDVIEHGTEVPVGQIVSVVPDLEEMPDEARHAARVAMKVLQEQRARHSSTDQRIPDRVSPARAPRSSPSPRRGREEARTDPGESGETRPSEEGEHIAVSGRPVSGSTSMKTYDGQALMQARREGQDPSRSYRPSLSPYASDDHLAHIDREGETNLLNTVPYRYAGFFERVKEAVRRQWDPNRPYRLRDPSGELFGHKDRLTVLSVTLDPRGYVLETRVSSKSGLKFLDDEAVRAMTAASPFLNPPEGLVGSDGTIRFEFGFAFLVASSRRQFFWRF
jgi:TonB family protein